MSVFLYVKNDSLCFHDNLVPQELVDIIFSKLDVRSLLNVDAVGKKFPLLTERAWKYIREKEMIAYDWHFLKGHSQKWSYHFNLWIKENLLQDVISSVFTTVINREPEEILYDRLNELFLRIAFWKEALKGEFDVIIDTESAISEEKSILQDLPNKEAEGGDLLIKGLLWGGETPSAFLYEAIQKNMTWASFLELVQHGSDSFSMELALAAASKGDYSGLQLLLNIEPNYVEYFDTYENPPPVLATLIFIANADLLLSQEDDISEEDLLEASKLYQEAIDILTSQNLPIPNYLLVKATDIEEELDYIDDAESLYTQCRDIKKDEASSPLFLNAHIEVSALSKAAFRKLDQQEWKPAETRFIQLITCYNPFDPQTLEDKKNLCKILPQLAFVKENLQDYKGASVLYDNTMRYYKERQKRVPLNIIGRAIAAMEQLQNWQGAYQLCSQEIDECTKSNVQVPPYLVGKEKVLRKQLEIAKCLQFCPDLVFFVEDPSLFTLYQQSLEHVGLFIPYHLLPNADALYEFLRNWYQVDLVFCHLFQVCLKHAPHIKIPTKIQAQAAYVKEKLEKWEEADALYARIIKEDRENASYEVLSKAIFVKEKLKQKDEALITLLSKAVAKLTIRE
jgi:hypothetical protein